MKKIILLSLLFLYSVVVWATVHTVSNDPARPAQFTSAATALNAAAPGDTLYIYGSPSSYGDLQVNKNITIIGAGNNTRKDAFYKTIFGFFDLTGASLNGVTIDGLYCQLIRIQGTSVVNYSNITIRNTIVFQSFTSTNNQPVGCGSVFSNWLIENSYIISYYEPVSLGCNPVSPVKNGFLFRNSIIASITGAYNSTFVNCHFGADGGVATSFSGQLNNTYNNCIFYRMNFSQNSFNANNQFNNCLTYQTQSPSTSFDLNSWTSGASGTANNCIINQNPLWVTVLSSTMFGNTTANVRNGWDPSINTGSPARNAGTDGTDIGLTGGAVPYNVSAEPFIPVIRKFQLLNAVVPPSGTVTVNATATKPQ